MNAPNIVRDSNRPNTPDESTRVDTKTCPNCGFAQEAWTSICPKCEQAWPGPKDDRDGTKARLAEFHQQLMTSNPAAWLTPTIIGINVAIYLGMLATGIHFLNPTIPNLMQWGANLGSATTSGQWWRLFTCMFLHIGLVHILFNMFVLWDIGRFVERLIGSAGFAIIYLLAGLSGSVASMWWNPHVVSAGASGAIFGLYGALIGYLLVGTTAIPADVAQRLKRNALVFLGYNLLFGLSQKEIDMAGHVGGLLAGLACGFAMAYRLRAAGASVKSELLKQVLVVGLAVVSLAAALRPKTIDLQQELARFSETESTVQATFNQALGRARSHALGDPDLAQLIDTEIIPPWHSARMRLEHIQGLPKDQARLLANIQHYAELREQGWKVFSEALKQGDQQGIAKANALQAEAEIQLKNLNK